MEYWRVGVLEYCRLVTRYCFFCLLFTAYCLLSFMSAIVAIFSRVSSPSRPRS